MNYKKKFLLLNIITLFIFRGIVVFSAGGSGGTTSSDFLKIGIGARPIAMGNAFSAMADEVSTLNYNPAGLANLYRHQFHYIYESLPEGMNYNYLAYAHTLGNIGTIATSIGIMDYGDIVQTTLLDPFGNSGGKITGRDLLFTLAYARTILPRTALGIQVKYIEEKLAETKSGAAVVDLGVLYYLPSYNLSLAATLQNVGTKMKFYSKKERMPFTVRFGSAYRAYLDRLRITLDAHNEIGTGWNYNAGGEFWVVPHLLAFRTGFDSSHDFGSGVTAGAGLHYNDFRLDYAFVPTYSFGNSHKVSGTLDFGAGYAPTLLPPPEERVKSQEMPDIERRSEGREETRLETEVPRLTAINTDELNRITPSFEEVKSTYSESLEELENSAMEAYEKADYKGAENLFRQILDKKPDHFNAAYNLAVVYYQLHRWTLAVDAFKTALRINPYSLEANLFIGLAYYQIDDFIDAKRAFERALEIDPSNSTARNNLDVLKSMYPE